MPLEAVSMQLTGELGENYDILYSVLQNQAWTSWAQNGEEAGVSGAGLRVDGIRVSVVKKREGQPSSVSYTHLDVYKRQMEKRPSRACRSVLQDVILRRLSPTRIREK